MIPKESPLRSDSRIPIKGTISDILFLVLQGGCQMISLMIKALG